MLPNSRLRARFSATTHEADPPISRISSRLPAVKTAMARVRQDANTKAGGSPGCPNGIFPPSQFAKCLLGVAAIGRSLFFPDIRLARTSRNAGAAGVFGIFARRFAVFFENHPDIGQITGRPVRI
jgi:hypothetical protein